MIVVPKDILNNDVKNNKLGPGPVAQCVLRLVKCFLSLYQNRGLGLIPGGKILEYRQEDRTREVRGSEGNSRTQFS